MRRSLNTDSSFSLGGDNSFTGTSTFGLSSRSNRFSGISASPSPSPPNSTSTWSALGEKVRNDEFEKEFDRFYQPNGANTNTMNTNAAPMTSRRSTRLSTNANFDSNNSSLFNSASTPATATAGQDWVGAPVSAVAASPFATTSSKQSRTSRSSGFAPPTASLASLVAASSANRNFFPSSNSSANTSSASASQYADGYSSNASLTASSPAAVAASAASVLANASSTTSSSSTSISISPHWLPSVSVSVFRQLMAGASLGGETWRFNQWMKEVRTWRAGAAAFWTACIALCSLHFLTFTLPTSFASLSLSPINWVSAYWSTCPLMTDTLMAVWITGLQAVLVVTQSHHLTPDYSSLSLALLPRLFARAKNRHSWSLFLVSLFTNFLIGYFALEILLRHTSLWNFVQADGSFKFSQSLAFLLVGFVTFIFFHSLCLILDPRMDIVSLPFLRVHSRARNMMLRLPRMVLRAAWKATKFSTLFLVAVWSWCGPIVAQLLLNVNQPASITSTATGTDAAPVAAAEGAGENGSVATAAAASSSFSSSLPSFSSFYHLFLVIFFLEFLAGFATNMLHICMIQFIEFRQYFLHALYATYGEPIQSELNQQVLQQAQMSSSSSADFLQLNKSATAAAAATAVANNASIFNNSSEGLVTDGLALEQGSNATQLTQYLAMQYLVELVSNPLLKSQRNLFLFREDMNGLFVTENIEAASRNSNGNTSLRSSASTAPLAVATPLPAQSPVIPVIAWCLALIRGVTERMLLEKKLMSSAETLDASFSSSVVGSAAATGSGSNIASASSSSTLDASASLQNYSRHIQSTTAFLYSLDGAGLVFPSKAQRTLSTFSRTPLINLAIQFLSFSLVHALNECNLAENGGSNGRQNTRSSAARGFSAASAASVSAFLGPCSLLSSNWVEPILECLLSLSLSLEHYVHSSYFLSPRDALSMQGHQVSRQQCLEIAAVLDQALYRITTTYYEFLSDLKLSPSHTSRLQSYISFQK